MNTLYKYFVIVLLLYPILGQDLSNDDIIVSKEDLKNIAESLINIGDFDNAIAIYQEILDYQINTLGLDHIDVAHTSDIIGELFVQTYRLEEAEIYFNQSLNIKSQLLYKQQIAIRPSLELLRDLYENIGDTLKADFLDKNLEILYKAETMDVGDENWSPFTFGLESLSDHDKKLSESEISFQAINLMGISSSYINAGLYYDAVNSMVAAISIDNSLSLSYLHDYIDENIPHIPEILNALMHYISQDTIQFGREKLLLSIIYYYQLEYDLARQYIESYIDIYTLDIRGYQLLGNYYYQNENYISALFNYRQSQQFDSKNIYSLFNQSLCLYHLGYYNESSSLLSTVISLDSYNFDAYYHRGLSYVKEEKHKKAINDFTEYILLNPNSEEIYYYLGISYYKIEKFHRAKESLERYLKFNNENGEAHYYLGIINENIVELETAIYHYTQARKYSPKIIDSNRRLGLLHYKNKNYNLAMEPLRDYIIFNPDSTTIMETFADILYNENRYPESIDAYQRLYISDSTNVDYLYNIANAYIALDDMSNAKEALTKYILLGKIDAEILFTLANIESELGDYKNSILHYQMTINLGKPTVNMFYNLAMSYTEIDNFIQALDAFKSAYKLDPNDFEIVYQIGICYKELKEYSDAINYFSIFSTEHPKDSLAHYLLAELYFLNSNYKLAQAHFQKSLTLNPSDSISLYYLGMCNQKLENFINAAKLFKKSIKIDPQFAPAHFELALTYETLGKTREMKKEINIVRMLDQELYSVLVEELEKN